MTTYHRKKTLFKGDVRLGSVDASDVALEAVHVFTFTTQDCEVGVTASGRSAAEENTKRQTHTFPPPLQNTVKGLVQLGKKHFDGKCQK